MESSKKLKFEWALWETYPANWDNKSHEAYMDNLKQIYTFDTLEDFAIIWGNLRHSSPSTFFFTTDNKVIKKVKLDENDESSFKQIESIAFFKKDVKPAWEDPKNHAGGDFQIKFGDASSEDIDRIWKRFVFEIIGGLFALDDKITGIRIIDKSKPPKSMARLEIWVDFNGEDEASKKQLEEEISKKLIEDPEIGGKLDKEIKWIDHGAAATSKK